MSCKLAGPRGRVATEARDDEPRVVTDSPLRLTLVESKGSPGGGIGIRARLKIVSRKGCGFDARPGHRQYIMIRLY
jgi:hypothetical protein